MKHRGIYLKKTALAVFTLGSSIAFAGSMGPICSPGSLTTPCKQMAWTVGGKALYLLPTYSGALVYQSTFSTYTPPTPTGPYTEIDTNYNTGSPNYGWGFQVEGAYHFNKGKDVNINWYRMHSTTNTNKAFGTNKGTPNNPQALPNPQTLNPQWDAVNLELGQTIGINDTGQARLYGGVQYARVNLTGDVDMPNNPLLTVPGVTPEAGTGEAFAPTDLEQDITYNGFGPRAGMDMAYHWGNGFAMYANSAMALLIGTSKFNNSVTGQSPDFLVFNGNGSTTKFVPELEAKLGATYTYAMAQGDLSLDVGWMWNNYFSVLDTGTGAGTTKSSDFAVQGPFIGLKWLGNVA